MSETSNITPLTIELTTVVVTLEVIDEHRGSAVVAHSALIDGRRCIAVKLHRSHELVARSLTNSDTLVVRFLVGISLAEYVLFWGGSHDGGAVRNALKRLADYEPGGGIWGTAFSSAIANCESLDIIDGLPIYGANAAASGPFELLTFEAVMKAPSDIARWGGRERRRGGRRDGDAQGKETVHVEKIKPPSKKSSTGLPPGRYGPVEMPEMEERSPLPRNSSPPTPVPAVEPSPRSLRRAERRQGVVEAGSAPDAAVAKPDPFLYKFHQMASAVLSSDDLSTLEAMAKEVGDV